MACWVANAQKSEPSGACIIRRADGDRETRGNVGVTDERNRDAVRLRACRKNNPAYKARKQEHAAQPDDEEFPVHSKCGQPLKVTLSGAR